MADDRKPRKNIPALFRKLTRLWFVLFYFFAVLGNMPLVVSAQSQSMGLGAIITLPVVITVLFSLHSLVVYKVFCLIKTFNSRGILISILAYASVQIGTWALVLLSFCSTDSGPFASCYVAPEGTRDSLLLSMMYSLIAFAGVGLWLVYAKSTHKE